MKKDAFKYQITVLLFGIVLIGLFNRCQKSTPNTDQTYTATEARVAMLISKAKTNSSDSASIYLKEAFELLDHIKRDSLKAKYIDNITSQAISLKDSFVFKKANAKVTALAIKEGDSLRLGHSHWNYGAWYLTGERYDSAYYHYGKALGLFENQNQDYYAGKMLYNMAITLIRLKNYIGADVLVFRAIKLFEPLKRFRQLYLCYNMLGVIHESLGNHEKAIEYYTEGLEYVEHLKDPALYRYHSLNNIGFLYQESGNHQRAISYFNEALDDPVVRKLDKALYARLLDNRAYSRLKLGDTVGIRWEFNRALKIRDSLKYKLGVLQSKYHLASYYAYKGDTLSGIQLANESYELAKTIQSNSDVLIGLWLLAELNPVKDGRYLKEYIVLNDRLLDRERQTLNKFFGIQYETEKFKDRNLELTAMNTWMLIIVVLLLLVLLISFIHYRLRIRFKQLELESIQLKANGEIFLALNKQFEKFHEGREEERLRISKMLHDGIVAELYGIRINWAHLNLIGNTENLSEHKEYLEALRRVENQIRDASHSLRTGSIFLPVNFTTVIAELAKKRAKTGKFEITIDADQEIDWTLYDSSAKMDLYYCINEALQNCIKHAKATAVIVNLKIQGDFLVVTIADDGVGISENSTKGIGLQNIQSRLDQLKGKFTIKSASEQGTELIISIPYIT